MATKQFSLDVDRLRSEARAHMDDGSVTPTYAGDKARIIEVLNDVIATEMVCYLRYSEHAIAASGIDRSQVAAEFNEHAVVELDHAHRAAERVSQLGGSPRMDPATFAEHSHTEYTAPDGSELTRMIEDNLVAERIVIAAYQEVIRWIGDGDPTTRRMLEEILADEEEHADDLKDLLSS
jgi:bacterioferritin